MSAAGVRLGCLIALSVVVSAFLASCQRHPLEAKVEARDDLGFAMWLSANTGDITADDRRELIEAQKQIKLAVMSVTPGLPPDEFRTAVYAEIYRHTVREVLLRGIEIQIYRIATEVSQLEKREEEWQAINPRFLAPEAREALESFKARMAERRTKLQRLGERKILLLAR